MSSCVWVSRLSLAALPALLGILFRYGRVRLRFISSTSLGRLLARIFWVGGILADEGQQVEFTLHGQRVDDRETGHLRIHAAINGFADQFFAVHGRLLTGLTFPDRRIREEQFQANLRKVIGQTIYELLLLTEFARYRHRLEGLSVETLLILSPAAVLARDTSFNWADWGYPDTVFRTLPSTRHSVVMRWGLSTFHCMAGMFRPSRTQRSRPNSVGIAAVWGLDRASRLNDLFWWWRSGIASERIVLIFDRSDQPASHDLVAQADKLGITCVVLDPRAVGDSPHLLWRPAPGMRCSLKRLRRNVLALQWALAGRIGRWMTCRILDMLRLAANVEDLLKEYNVRALFHHNDGEMDYLSLACEMSSAARIGHHWSNHHWPLAYHTRLHQVFFAWGMHHVEILDAASSVVPNVLLSGCTIPGVYEDTDLGREGKKARSAVTAKGATRVLALFDTSVPCEGMYAFFLAHVANDPRWGMLIKPKGTNSIRWAQATPTLRDLFQKGLATGRVMVLDWRMTPAEAAAAADITVGVDINSATVLAALAGHRAIHLDYVRLQDSKLHEWACFYKLGPDRLVFGDPDKLWAKLNLYFDSQQTEQALGVVNEDLLKKIDPFRDKNADVRIANYVQWYLEGLDSGLERDDALDFCNAKYRDRWGAHAVVRCRRIAMTTTSSSDLEPTPTLVS